MSTARMWRRALKYSGIMVKPEVTTRPKIRMENQIQYKITFD